MTTMPDATHYTQRVAWSVEDGEHVATVVELPSLSWVAPTPVEALAGLADVVRDVLADLAASGEPIPGPLSELPLIAGTPALATQQEKLHA